MFSQFLEKRVFHSELDEAFSFFDSKMDRYEAQQALDSANEAFETDAEPPVENVRVYLVVDVLTENLQPVCVPLFFLFQFCLPATKRVLFFSSAAVCRTPALSKVFRGSLPQNSEACSL